MHGLHLRNDEQTFKWFLEAHNDVLGHSGGAETQRRILKNDQSWNGMHRDIKRFISLLPLCQKYQHGSNNNFTFTFTISSRDCLSL